MNSEKNKGGRPLKYDDKLDDTVYRLALLGAIDCEMAKILDIAESTFHKWKQDFPSFSESIKKGKEHADANVANRLYQRALGFEHDSEDIKVVNGGVERVPIRKVYPPDTTAAIFWLKNRQPDKWRDKQEIDHTSKGESIARPDLTKLTDDELRAIANLQRKSGISE